MANLRITVGLPGSGKTTISKQMHGYRLISHDDISFEITGGYRVILHQPEDLVWRTTIDRIRKGLSHGINIVNDGTNGTIETRRQFLLMKKLGLAERVEAVVVVADMKSCMERIMKRGRKVEATLMAFECKLRYFSLPTLKEGFDKIITIQNH